MPRCPQNPGRRSPARPLPPQGQALVGAALGVGMRQNVVAADLMGWTPPDSRAAAWPASSHCVELLSSAEVAFILLICYIFLLMRRGIRKVSAMQYPASQTRGADPWRN